MIINVTMNWNSRNVFVIQFMMLFEVLHEISQP
jgi:hypothetical protein